MPRLLLLLATIVVILSVSATAADDGQATPDPLGKLVDLGGRRLHLHRMGSGSPAVIIENGNGGFSIDWALVQPEVAKFAQVCSYDRAGYAWSERGSARGTVEQTMDDLHLLLRKAGIRPPYVLVGASIGGIYTRAYQRRYPEEVVGMVLDDPCSDEGLGYRINGKDKLIHEMSAQEMHDVFQPLLRNPPKREALTTLEEPFDRLPKNLQTARLWAARKFFAEEDMQQDYVLSESWREEFIALRRERLSQQHPLGNLPLIVMGRKQNDMETRQRHLNELKGLSSAGKLVMAENSEHEIHLYRPELVVQSIKEVVTAVRNKRPEADKR